MSVSPRWILAFGPCLFVACASIDTSSDPTPTASPVTSAPEVTIDSAQPPPIEPAAPSSELQEESAGLPTAADATFEGLPADTLPNVVDVSDLGADDDPSFELGPVVVLDLDVARFPVDDAGVGGGVPAEEDQPDVGVPPATSGWAGFDAALESSLIRPGNTAASVAVSIGGDVVHRAAFGFRDPATGDPAEPHDRFRVASISKTITAITAMQLVEDGLVGLDDPVGQLVADSIGAGEVGSSGRLTLRQLLTHRSGFGKYQPTFFRGGADDCVEAARTGLRSGASGGGYVYSNMNYCVAGLAIEALTGLSYEQAVYRYLLTPLGLSGMRLAPTIDPGPDEIQHVTTPGRNYMETLGAAGAWIASPTDLVTIMDSLDASTPGFKPLDPETVLQMIVPFGGQLGQRGYGYGMISYGGLRFGHTGTIESTHAMLLNRGDGVTWAVTVAGQSPSESTDLERIVNAAFAAGGFVAG